MNKVKEKSVRFHYR
ncbi:hypothetical protein C5167_003338 [Papaver somniferum]|uniref:Uncharacterized protein n=1 Tax=Papaver somniferum TaxID=3469 RepID=A0A4Y7L3B8_PAPSO|nr:hypothetical protein C5167_003338 [Papaver somniferum]